jgi:hypothetical protein
MAETEGTAGATGGLSIDSAASKLTGLLSGPPKKTNSRAPAAAADAGAEGAPPTGEADEHDEQNSATADAAPGDDESRPSGDEGDQGEPAEASQEDQSPIEPPASWDAAGKEAFRKLDRATQEIIHSRETARDKEVRRMQTETDRLKKGGDAQAQQVTAQLQQHFQHLGQLAEALQAQVANEFADIKTPADAQRLAADDPPRYLRLLAQQQLLESARQHQRAFQANESAKAEQARVQRLVDEHTKLAESDDAETAGAKILAAEGKDGDAARGELRTYLLDSGFSNEDVAGLDDHKATIIAWKALQFDKAKKSVVASRKTPLPKANLKPGGASDRQDGNAGVTASLVQRARKSGDVKDAGRAISRLIN